jgi:hypothetical protein
MRTPNAIDLNPLFTRKESDGTRLHECLLCGRAVDPQKARLVHLIGGGYYAIPTDQEYEEMDSDLGWWELGRDCARKLPANYTINGAGWLSRS